MPHRLKTLAENTLARHSCETSSWGILAWQSFLTLLKETAFWTLWSDTLAGHPCWISWMVHVGHSCQTVLPDTLVKDSCQTLLRSLSFLTLLLDTVFGHSCRPLSVLSGCSCVNVLSDTHAGHSWQDTFARRSLQTLLGDTLTRHSCGAPLLDTFACHPCGHSWKGRSRLKLLLHTLCWALFLDTLAWHSCQSLF